MKIIFGAFFIFFLMGIMTSSPAVLAGEDFIILNSQDEYDVVQDRGLRIRKLKTSGFGEDGAYSTPDIGVNGSVSLGGITISGRFDLTLNNIDGADILLRRGTRIIAYDSLGKLILQKD